jgi:hypothetical protein
MSEVNSAEGVLDALFDMVLARYGHRLTLTEQAEVKKGIEQGIENAQALKAVPLTNSDEPFSVFSPYNKAL